jgi:ERF superfamily
MGLEAAMRTCSESIAQLAAALAKAQMELVNPVKSLTGVIDRWGTGNEGQTYRYAPLSAGLDIVRQTLCKHELAVIQTTHVDQETGMVMLTSTLAHGSGEWISASWPVCRTADMTNPKLMGAALTYARRYGLFTMVGIAGEDDLDAPASPPEAPEPPLQTDAKPNGAAPGDLGQAPANENSDQNPRPLTPEMFGYQAGVKAPRRKRRDAGKPRRIHRHLGQPAELILELAAIPDADALLRWTIATLPTRNSLPDHAKQILDASFFERAKELGASPDVLAAITKPTRPPSP